LFGRLSFDRIHFVEFVFAVPYVAEHAMTSIWNDLASSERWRGVVSFIRNWVGPFDAYHGMAADELDMILRGKHLQLPPVVREWYLLAAKRDKGGLVWIRPDELTLCDGMIWILTDREGINHWGVGIADVEIEDPPVVSYEGNPPNAVDFPTFLSFVTAMIANDVLFDYETEEPVELNPHAACEGMTCIVSARCGDLFADSSLESATIIMFAYPENGPVFGKSRTPAGRARLEGLRIQKV
jgi:hypothetical protein